MEPNNNAWPTMQPKRTDRRTDARLSAPARLRCTVAGIDANLRVRNISARGLAIYALSPIKTRSEHQLTLVYDDLMIVRRVRVVYCRVIESSRWLVGMAVLDSNVGGTLDELIDAITASESPTPGA